MCIIIDVFFNAAMNPESALKLVGNPEMDEIAKEVRIRVENALRKL